MSKKNGQCLCGAITYTVTGPILGINYCHCLQCRRATGSAFGTSAAIELSQLIVNDALQLLRQYESSPRKYRYFCSRCGSPLYSHKNGDTTAYLRLGTLTDHPERLPDVHIHVASKAQWHKIDDDLPQREHEEDLDF